MDTSNAYTGNITLNAYGNVNINGTAIYINNPLNTVGILSSVNTSTFTAPPINFVNTHTAPNTTLSVLGPNMGALSYNGIEVGQSDTTGNTGSFNFQWAGNNNASNKIFIEFFGGGGTNLTLYNSTSTGALFNSNLSAIQYTSTVAIGTAPLVVTSTTLVALLYVARSALADTCTTIPALTGDVTSVANVTTYNNAVPIAKGGTGVVGGLASPGTIGGTAAGIVNATTVAATSTVTGTQLISNIAIGTAPLVVTSTTVVPNLNVSQLLGGTWAIPGTIGSTTANTGAFTTLTTNNNTSSSSTPPVSFINNNAAPLACVGATCPNIFPGNEANFFIGQALANNASAGIGYIHASFVASRQFYFGGYGGTTRLTLFGSAATPATLNCPLTITGTVSTTQQLTSTVVTGTAPIVVTSTTLVALLYVARSALADTVTTNANLSGVITSGGNVTSFTNGSTGSGAVVLQTSPTVSTLTVSSGGIHQVAGDLVVDVGAVTLGAGSIDVTLGAITASVGDITAGVYPIAYSRLSPLSIYSTGSITTLGNATHLGLTVAAAASIGTTLSVIGLTSLAATNVSGSFSAIGLFNVVSPFAITLNATGAAEDILIEASGAASNIQLLANGAGLGTITIETAGGSTGDISILGNVFDCANV